MFVVMASSFHFGGSVVETYACQLRLVDDDALAGPRPGSWAVEVVLQTITGWGESWLYQVAFYGLCLAIATL
jgi:hypothetical protein